MCRSLCFWLTLLSACPSIAAQSFLLGVSHSQQVPAGSLINIGNLAAATDSGGNLYLLAEGVTVIDQQGLDTSYLLKLTPTGDQVIYQTLLPFEAYNLAVDPAGNAYLVGYNASGVVVEKLGADGKTVVYQNGLGANISVTSIAADPSGRLYLTGSAAAGQIQTTPSAFQPAASTGNSHAFVIRFDSSGHVDYATYLGGSVQDAGVGIAVDSSGSAFVAGTTSSPDFPVTPGAYLATFAGGTPSFLTRLNAAGSGLIYSTFTDTQGSLALRLAVDAADNAVVALVPYALLVRFDPHGAVVFSKLLPADSVLGLAVDGAGNTYVEGFATTAGYPVKNNLAMCQTDGSVVLSVLDPAGNLLQSTYLTGAWNNNAPLPAMTALPDSTVDLVGWPQNTYTPPQPPTAATSGMVALTQLSPDAPAQTIQLACAGNAASFDPAAISPGEIVSLFGNGLGPLTGMQPQVTTASGFPSQLAGVEVTFNGSPGPLLYVQDGQINAVAPWSIVPGLPVEVCVTYDTVATNCLTLPVVQEHPGIFTVDGNHAAAVNQDGSLNTATNPARTGSIVSIFATGLGPLDPAQADGSIIGFPLPVNALPINMYGPLMGVLGPASFPITLTYAGPAPYEVAGVTQINFVVPLPPIAYIQTPHANSNEITIYVAQ